MLLTEINVDDLDTLMYFRIERLLYLFASSLPSCLIQLDPGNTLFVHCPDAAIVDDLLDKLEDLRHQVWLILGIRTISLYLGQEEILHTNTLCKLDQN
jgi:hypothetical protein